MKLQIIQIPYKKIPREISIPLIKIIKITVIAILSRFFVPKSSMNFKKVEFLSLFKKKN